MSRAVGKARSSYRIPIGCQPNCTDQRESPWWTAHEPDRVVIDKFLSRYRLPVRGVIFTEHQPKADTLLRHGIELHYDDDPREVALAQAAGIQSVLLNGVSFHV